jgi:chaperonin GroEL
MGEIFFTDEARNRLFEGVRKLHSGVASTMGPSGRTVIICDEYGQPRVTKDGVSVARAINFKDPIEQLGAILVKEVAERTVDQAGDGTTTAIVLANAFIQNLKGYNSLEINKAFEDIIPKVLQHLKDNSRELKREDIKYVASISANNDIQIGNIIQQAYNFSSIVKVEESNSLEDAIEEISGMKLDVSFFSKRFANTPKETCEFSNPHVLIVDGKIEDLNLLKTILTKISIVDESLLIIAEHVSEKEMRKLETNVMSGNINLCVIKTPGFGPVRKDFLRDISDFTGAEIVSLAQGKAAHSNCLGKLESCTITKNHSLLVKHEDINVDEIVNGIKGLSDLPDLSDYDKNLLNKRIENLTAKATLIRVGGKSEIEMKERKDRYDDAVLAVACALEEGIVEGGGVALYKSLELFFGDYLENTPEFQITESLTSPFRMIAANGTKINTSKNMFLNNIIDPLKVTRCALENAASVAKTVLSTDCIVLNPSVWN